ncbi:HPP family protein [Timonella senegalensis]
MLDLKLVLETKAPPRIAGADLFSATLTATAALVSLVGIGVLSGHVLLIPPMAASVALIAGAPTLPLAQPRNVIGGQLISACVGVAVGSISHSPWAAAVAGGLALGAMLLTRTSHSPAAATAVIGATTTTGLLSFVMCAGIAAMILVVFGLIRGSRGSAPYPTYWW